MLIIPAIDILNSKVVRLFQGDYGQVTHYSNDPFQVAQEFVQQGFKFIHFIDLAGAREGRPLITKEVEKILTLPVEVQVGGGIRTIEDAEAYINMGVKRIIIGTQAIKEPSFVDRLIAMYGDDVIAFSLDLRNGLTALNGWVESQLLSVESILQRLEVQGVKHVIVTDISRDGTLQGSNPDIYQPLVNAFPAIKFYAAGGVTTNADIEKLEQIGLSGVIVGKAFYEARKLC